MQSLYIFFICLSLPHSFCFFFLTSVTRLGDFSKLLSTNFYIKDAQMFSSHFGYFEIHRFWSNYCIGYFFATFGNIWATFYPQHLVTLILTKATSLLLDFFYLQIGHSQSPFCLFLSLLQLTANMCAVKSLPMIGFESRTTRLVTNHSANWAQHYPNFFYLCSFH